MNINEKINKNAEESEYLYFFKNRKWQQIGGWTFEQKMFINVRKEFKNAIIKKANSIGFFEP